MSSNRDLDLYFGKGGIPMATQRVQLTVKQLMQHIENIRQLVGHELTARDLIEGLHAQEIEYGEGELFEALTRLVPAKTVVFED